MTATKAPPPPSIDLGSALMLAALACLWGGTYGFVGIAVREVTPLTLVLCRLVLGAAALHPVRMARGMTILPSLWPRLAAMALLNNAIPFALIFWAQTRMPVVTVGLGALMLGEAPGLAAIVGRPFSRP